MWAPVTLKDIQWKLNKIVQSKIIIAIIMILIIMKTVQIKE